MSANELEPAATSMPATRHTPDPADDTSVPAPATGRRRRRRSQHVSAVAAAAAGRPLAALAGSRNH